ncbi:hypothetical protein [Legionella saoudiensis]|uniref:hypothetical protein n=1 Tax=Legionella saoudiensis TaxID=1750561 RepID=UPI000730860C|nr:hypothetical protein [Legionella saoudiensis]
MNKISYKNTLLMALAFTTSIGAWAQELAELSIDSISINNGVVASRPCPKKIQGNCAAGVPSSCTMVFTPSVLSGTLTITNNSAMTALNVTTNQAFISSYDIFQSPETGLASIPPHSSDTLTFFASGFPINPPVQIEVKGSNTSSACFSIQVVS